MVCFERGVHTVNGWGWVDPVHAPLLGVHSVNTGGSCGGGLSLPLGN